MTATITPVRPPAQPRETLRRTGVRRTGNGAKRFWYDTEFIDDGHTIELISVGMVCSDGREFYAENSEVDLSVADEWVKTNVVPLLWDRTGSRVTWTRWRNNGGAGGHLSCADIAQALVEFVAPEDQPVELWGYFADYDHVALCQLYGRMVDLPKAWPHLTLDVKQLAVSLGNPKLPPNVGAHNALVDAHWTRTAYEHLIQLQRGTRQ